MADLPNASVTIDDEAGGFAGAEGYVVVIAPVPSNADAVPRPFASAKSLLGFHGYAPGVDFSALHIQKTGLPVLFCGIAIAAAGVVGSVDSTGVTGTSRITAVAGGSGCLDETEGSVRVVNGGTVGTNGITFDLSMDGERTKKRLRLGTATSYAVTHLGITINFGAGTLVAGDVFRFRTTAPMWDSAGLALARAGLVAQQKLSRSWLIEGEVANSTQAGYVTTQVNAYETENDRFTYARAQVKDLGPRAAPFGRMSRITKRMTGAPTLSFAEVGVSGDTITRSTGSWTDDGFVVGDLISVTGSASNNISAAPIASLTATVITLGSTDLVDEAAVAGCAVSASPSLTFAEVGSTGDTVTRSSGSWVDDGFKVGDVVEFAGTASNNVSGAIASLTATVLTFGTTDLAAEVVRSDAVTCKKVLLMPAYVSAMDAAFAVVDDQKRIDLAIGRATIESPITGWSFRRPAAWHASIREYAHDLHVATYEKDHGPLDGADLTDGNGTVVEFDERIDAGALAGRFTCLRTWANGPNGAFVALSLTRATEASILSRTHNMAVVNLGCTIVQAETENFVGKNIVLNKDGTADAAELKALEQRVNRKLERHLLEDKKGEGQRASRAFWTASKTDKFDEPGATLNGTFEIDVNGTIEKVATRARVNAAA